MLQNWKKEEEEKEKEKNEEKEREKENEREEENERKEKREEEKEIEEKNNDTFDDSNAPKENNKFEKLIAPQLFIDNLTITDTGVDVLGTNLQYLNVKKVTLDIRSTTMPSKFQSLMDILSLKKCELSIKEITDIQLESWLSAITQNIEINLTDITLHITSSSMPTHLPTLIKILSEKNCKITIKEITTRQIELWTSIIKQNDGINLKDVTFNIESTAVSTQLHSFIEVLKHKKCNLRISCILDEQVKIIKSAVGIYEVVLDILDKMLENKIVDSHPDGLKKIKNDVKELNYLQDSLKDENFIVSLVQFRLLRDILNFEDASLVKKHGHEVIEILRETGMVNNSKWFELYSKFEFNPTVADDFGKLIATQLDTKNFTITDENVEFVGKLLPYVDIDEVQFDISSTNMHSHSPDLKNILRNKKCNFVICNIQDEQTTSWDSIITQNDKVEISKVTLKNEYTSLPLQAYRENIEEFCLQLYWRELHKKAPTLTEWPLRKLWTTLITVDDLPTSLQELNLGLLVDPTTGLVQDPGLSQLTNRCPELEELGVHVKSTMRTENLPNLPDVASTNLYLSQLSDDNHVQWAVGTARLMHPQRGYSFLALPCCRLNQEQLSNLLIRLAAAGVKVAGVSVSSSNSYLEKQLQDITSANLDCDFYWYQDDDELNW